MIDSPFVTLEEKYRRQARDDQQEAWRRRLRSLQACSCNEPVPGRRYMGIQVCERCGMVLPGEGSHR